MELDLKDKRVLVTASSAGIGLAVAESFLREGARVIINGRNKSKLSNVCDDLKKIYGENMVYPVVADATVDEGIELLVNVVKSSFDGLDILIPCVGTGRAISDNRLDVSEWQHMMENNIFSAVRLIDRCRNLLVSGVGSNIVLVSSVVACSRANAPYAYAASKGALFSLNSYLARDLADINIRINCVVPGNIFFEGGRWDELRREDESAVDEYINDSVPMKRFGIPEEIADSVVFLASERSSYTTGAVLTVDGGQNRSI